MGGGGDLHMKMKGKWKKFSIYDTEHDKNYKFKTFSEDQIHNISNGILNELTKHYTTAG